MRCRDKDALTIIYYGIMIAIILLTFTYRSAAMATHTVRTTLVLPADLLAAVDQAVQTGKARSRNELVAMALRRELAAQQRAAIDAAFAAMAKDPAYQAEAQEMAAAFAVYDLSPRPPCVPQSGALGGTGRRPRRGFGRLGRAGLRHCDKPAGPPPWATLPTGPGDPGARAAHCP